MAAFVRVEGGGVEVAAFVRLEAQRLVPFQLAASCEYFHMQINIPYRDSPRVIDMQADVTSALRMRSDSLIRGDIVTTRARHETGYWRRRTASQTS